MIMLLVLSLAPLPGGQMVVFGDSLSDGGFFIGTRFTDNGGELWHEFLADALSLERATTTSFGLSGLNFAVGGSVVADLPNQVGRYALRDTWEEGDLCTLWIGGNDVRSSPSQDMTVLAQEIGEIIAQLNDLGVDRLIVPNLPDIGAIPEYRDDPAAAMRRTEGTVAFNDALARELEILSGALAVVIHPVDIFGLFEQMLLHAREYGYVNTSEPLRSAAGNPDPASYVFWDDIHPTSRSHFLISAASRTVIDPGVPLVIVSQTIQPDLALRQTWLGNPGFTYQIVSSPNLQDFSEAIAVTGSPAHTVVLPAPGLGRGFYQTRLIR